mgnify:CR=1 FL=1
MFDVWMRLLNEVERSVLWLSAAPADTVRNLRSEALARGISGERLVFAPFVPTVKPVFDASGKFSGIEQTHVQLFDMPLAWFIAIFFAMSAIAHATAGWLLRGHYERWLARGMNPLRWVEYAFSSTVMILAIAYLSYIRDFPALIAIAGCNVAMNLFGWSMEEANIGRKTVQWSHYVFGCIAGIVPWLAIFVTLALSLNNWVGTETFKPVLIEKLAIFDDECNARNAVAARYAEGLKDAVSTPVLRDGCT